MDPRIDELKRQLSEAEVVIENLLAELDEEDSEEDGEDD